MACKGDVTANTAVANATKWEGDGSEGQRGALGAFLPSLHTYVLTASESLE